MRMYVCLVLSLGLSFAPALGEEVTITGRVVGPGGAAIPGARVMVYRAPDGPGAWWVEGAAGADGRFAISFTTASPRQWPSLVALAEGHAIGVATAPPGEDVTIRVTDPPMAVEGRVLDLDGNPLPGRSVRATSVSPPTDGEPQWYRLPESVYGWVTTDADGRCRIDGFAPDMRVSLTAGGEGWATWQGYGHQRFATPGETFDIRLEPEATIRGRVLFQGQPLTGVEVSAFSDLGTDRDVADDAGRFTLDRLPPGEYSLSTGYIANATLLEPVRVTVGVGEALEGVEIAMLPSPTIHGRVTFAETGEPAEGVEVVCAQQVGGWWAPWGTRETGADGRYEFRPPAREWQVSCEYAGRVEPRPTMVTLAPSQVATVDFRILPRRALSGTVVGPDGQAVEGATVVAGRDEDAQATTDEQGHFRIENWGLPIFGVRCMAYGPDETLVAFARPERGSEDVRIELRPVAGIILRVEDAKGNPVQGVEMLVGEAEPYGDHGMSSYPLPVTWVSDEEGVIRMAPLPSGVTLMPHATDTLRGMIPRERYTETYRKMQQLTLEPGETRDLGTIVVATGDRSLTGVVLRDGKPEASALVVAGADSLNQPLSTRTGDDGRFQLEGLPPVDDVTVIAFAADLQVAAGALWTEDAAAPETLELKPLAAVEGTVIGADGTPIEGALIVVSVPGATTSGVGAGPGTVSTVVISDAGGRWRVNGLIAGFEYRIGLTERMHEGGPLRAVSETAATVLPDGETEPFVVDIDLRPRSDE